MLTAIIVVDHISHPQKCVPAVAYAFMVNVNAIRDHQPKNGYPESTANATISHAIDIMDYCVPVQTMAHVNVVHVCVDLAGVVMHVNVVRR